MRKFAVLALLLAGVLTLGATPMRAQGGACPAGANYVNPANNGVAGALVTLNAAGLGVTTCYFAAASGSDSNNGTSEATPFLHAPGMVNCTATCATATIAPGIGLILRGNDTWHYFSGSPQIGLPSGWPTTGTGNATGWLITPTGTPTNYIYIGVDPTWFSGSSWGRPIINNDNPVNPNGPTSFFYGGSNIGGRQTIAIDGIVSSCAFPQGELIDIGIEGPKYTVLDNIEFTGMCWQDTSNNTNVHEYVKHFGGGGSGPAFNMFYNLYLHGFTHKALVNNGLIQANVSVGAAGTGCAVNDTGTVNNGTLLATYQITGCTGGGVSAFTITYGGTGYSTGTRSTLPLVGSESGFTISVSAVASLVGSTIVGIQGSSQGNQQGTQFLFDVFDWTDSDETSVGSALGIDSDAYIVGYNVFKSSGSNILDNCHAIHDNLFDHINNAVDGVAHTDMFFCFGEYASNNFFYNNLIRYIGTTYNASLSTLFWFNNQNTSPTTTDYIFNNVEHDANMCGNFMNFEAGVAGSAYQIFGNTMQMSNSTNGSPCAVWENGTNPGSTFAGTITEGNNHYITGTNTTSVCQTAFSYPPVVNGGGACPDLFMTTAAANAAGYTSANDYAPTSSSSPTVGAGANETSISAPFGAAFLSTTTAGVQYNTTNHTAVSPNVTPANRPASGACPGIGCWNMGAFGFVSPTVALAPAPYAFAATALGSNSSDSPVTFTLTNNTGVTITGVTISFTGANPGDFTETTSCVTSLASSASCQIFVTFTPTAIGSRSATLSVSDSDASSPQTSSLSGTAISSVINPSPANPVTFGVVVTDPSIPSTVKNEKPSENLSAYNFGHVALVAFLHQDRARNTASASARQ